MSEIQLAWFVSINDRRDSKQITARIRGLQERDSEGKRDLSYGHGVSGNETPFYAIEATGNTYDSWLSDTDSQGDWIYGAELLWSEAFNLANAEVGVKALRKIHKYLTDAHSIAGSPASFSQWLLRIMKASKVTKVVMEIDDQKKILDIDYACRLIDIRWQGWKNAARGIVAQSA